MAIQTLQVSRWFKVFPSDDAKIPNPKTASSTGSATSTVSGELADTAATFITDGIKAGDIIYNTTDSTAATIDLVKSETELELNADIMANLENYIIYTEATPSCNLYVGVSGDLVVVGARGGDEATFVAAPAGYQPLQVDQVKATGTTATDIIALW